MSKNVSAQRISRKDYLMHPLNPDYIVGLVDGEGYFSVTARIDESRGYRAHEVRLVFGMKISEKDGKILADLRGYFRCGSIYYRRDLRKNFCDCIEYQVRNHKDILGIIIPFFRKHPLKFSSKKKAFKYFCEIANIVVSKEHLSEEGIKTIQRLSKLMH